MKLLPCYALAVLALFVPDSPLSAQSVWNVTTGNWNVAGNWSPAGVPVSGPELHLRFNATSSYTSTNNLGALTLNRLTVNNTGNGTLTLAASSTANTLTFDGLAPTLDITGITRVTGILAGSATITKTGSGTFIQDSNSSGFTGTIIINEGRFSSWGGTSTGNAVTTNFNPVSIVVNDGGTYQFGNAGIGDPNLPLTTYITVNEGGTVSWQETQTFGGFNLLGGSISLTNGTATPNGTTAQSWTHGSITGNIYTASAYNMAGSAPIFKTTAGTVTMSGAVALTNTGGLRLQEGKVVMAHAMNLGTAPLTFGADGTTGTLEYQGASALRAGNLIRSTGGTGVIQVTQASTILTLSGANTGSGILSKKGPGTLYLSGSFAATGPTQVAEGMLRVNPVTASGGFYVEAGTVLAVNSGNSSSSFSLPALVMQDTATLLLELGRDTVSAHALVKVGNTDGFFFNEGAVLQVTNSLPFANGTYTLLDYAGTAITSGLTLQLPGRTLGSLVYDVDNTQIQMNITGTDSVKWTGAVDTAWDVGTAAGVGGTDNWQLVTGSTATNFIQTDTVLFDDSAARFDVQIQEIMNPFSIKVDASEDYTFSGTGKITGTTGLSKSGTGTLVLATDNDYTGGTVVTGGTLQLGNGGGTGSITGPLSLANSTLAFNHAEPFFFDNAVNLTGSNTLVQNGAATVTMNSRLALGTNTLTFDGIGMLDLAGAITGSGVINKNGSGHLNLLGLNTFNGTLNINAGTVQLTDRGSSGDISAKSIMVNDGGTFIFGGEGNPDLPGTTIITVNTGGLFELRTGETYGGLVLNGGDYLVTTTAGSLASNGETTVPGTVVIDLRSGTMSTQNSGTGTGGGALGQSGGGVAAKTTSGTVTMGIGMTFNANLALQVREGTLAMPTTSVPATGTAVVSGGPLAGLEFGTAETQGTLQIYGSGIGSTSRNITLHAGGGKVEVTEPGTVLNFTGAISGDGPLIKTGAGTLNLSGNLDSTGLTTVSEGTLRLKPGTMAGGLATVDGALLAVSYDAVAASLNVPAVMLAGGSVLQYEFASSTLPVLPLVNVTDTDALSLGGEVLLRLTNSQHFATGLYTLLDYSGSAITSGFALELAGRASGTLNYDTAGTKITATILQGEEVRWTGTTNAKWDAGTGVDIGGTQNWQTITSLASTNFVQADFVHFDDTASRFDVTLEGVLRPNAVSINAASDYTFNGSGKISGITALNKSGSGTLVLATDNDYSGGTTVSGGSLQLGNGGISGSITGPLVLSGGSLAFNRSDDFTLSSPITLGVSTGIVQNGSGLAAITSALALGSNVLTITGEGDLRLSGVISGTALEPVVMNGSGTLYLPATNTFTGTTVINSGTVSVSSTRGLGATTADVFINGGTLQLTASNLGSVTAASRTVTIGPAGGTLDFQSNQTFQGSGFFGAGNVVKTGPGRWSVGSNASTFSGEILIAEGSLLMTSAQLNLAKNLTVAAGAQFIIDDNTAGTWSMASGGKYTFNGTGGGEGALRQINSSTSQNAVFTTTFNRELNLAGDTLVSTEVATGTISLTGNVTGEGMLTKQGPGTLRFAATGNTYTGGTLITGGTLLVANSSGSATGTGAVTIASGARLLGTGRITGNVILQNGALLQGGTATAAGTLTLTGETVLEAGSQADFRLIADGSSDRLVLEAFTLDTSATLRILLNYAADEGDTFNLLDWTTLGTGSDTNWVDNLDLSQAILSEGLKWDTSLFNSDGILIVGIIPEPSRALLLVSGLGCLLMRRRKR
ncbi:autotransporter-associated beta strand repeat-containing protein [Prosthecobacter sp. SYSU 5D2]|uniref:beta strand repeat-containing protein n=1 Tax=Prosthecobacter sp. SYSU 5D2 TaxID=3134134 RepID=UPI0031FF1BD6